MASFMQIAQSMFSSEHKEFFEDPITEAEVLTVQQIWGKAIVDIGKAVDPNGLASECVDALYAYDIGPVLFKPTLAADEQFRKTKVEALSYFVGGKIKEDNGFALRPWTHVRFENDGILLNGCTALAMGNYYFTQTDGEVVKVEYSFGYIKDDEGNLKINLHHSSLPYQQ